MFPTCSPLPPSPQCSTGGHQTHGRKRRGGRLSFGVGGLTALHPQLWAGQGLARGKLGFWMRGGDSSCSEMWHLLSSPGTAHVPRAKPRGRAERTPDTLPPNIPCAWSRPSLLHLQDSDRSYPSLSHLRDGDSPAQVPTRVPTRQAGAAPLSCPFPGWAAGAEDGAPSAAILTPLPASRASPWPYSCVTGEGSCGDPKYPQVPLHSLPALGVGQEEAGEVLERFLQSPEPGGGQSPVSG